MIILNISDKGIVIHTPVTPNKFGNISNDTSKNTKVLKNERIADILPLFKAVNIAEENMFIPINRRDIEKILNPLNAIVNTDVPTLAKILITGLDNMKDSKNVMSEIEVIARKLILYIFFRLPVLFFP